MENQKSERAQREEKILSFWKENDIFKKTLEKDSPKGEFVFFEGPPTANGRPGIHHIEARSFKDAIPRYKTMQGFHVRRKAGWDTHGLPVELEVEKNLGLKSKKEIEEYGVDKFNEECKKNVWKYIDEWKEFTDRVGYWVDLDKAYVTYHNSYIESVWAVIAYIEKRNLLYKDYKVVPWCPRCGTALSSHELAQGYSDVKDLSVYAKFKIVGFPDAYFLAWTTTPWTLPGNVALAVGADITYVEAKVGNEIYVLAKEKLSLITEPYEVIAEHKGSEMVGMEYEPLYPFIKENYKGENLPNAYKVYAAGFVTTEDGTGIVHTAVMYGQEDFELGNKIGLPKHHLVDDSGHFKPEAGFLAGRFVKEEETDVEIIKDLAHRGLLFKKEKYEHSYPHCWRCKTPLIYYARDSWYIRMSELREELVKENEKINWEPNHIKEGRFGEWLREVKDWALSRERYWGTPLPVWHNSDGSKRIMTDSLETLKKYTKSNGNKFIFVRHGESETNVEGIVNCDPAQEYHLTDKGKEEVKNSCGKIHKADAMYVSPYIRTKETAEIMAESLGFAKEKIVTDERLSEFNFGDLNGKKFSEYLEYEEKNIHSYDTSFPGGESYNDAKKRFGDFIYEIDSKHKNETIVVVTHGIGLEVAKAILEGANLERAKEIIDEYAPLPSEVLEFEFVPLPHNANYELDLHKPYIDDVVLIKDGEEYTRVKEVIDVWFDSGAMPFAQDAAERENSGDFSNVLFPADYISEAIDQTRGWFYTLHAVGVLMNKGQAYRNVVCLGHILDKEGKKMSKSVGNVVNPWEMIDKYGVDTLRLWMYSVNQPGESKNFDERTVDEISKRVFNLLDNVYSFYELYRDEECENREFKLDNPSVLDSWILMRLSELTEDMTFKLDNYKLLEPVRALKEFIDDLSTWYLRRSRDRIKEGDKNAKRTLYHVLKEVSKLLAPFAPFAAEDLYQKLRTADSALSVHLSEWPLRAVVDKEKIERMMKDMEEVRRLVSVALELRSKANIKVRQPLSELRIKNTELKEEYLELIKEELNVKKVTQDSNLSQEVELETEITQELEEEGKVREIIRNIQDLRKEKNLKPGESMAYDVPEADKELFAKFREEIQRATNIEF
jgi:isoleucyl-tRNA synthetase